MSSTKKSKAATSQPVPLLQPAETTASNDDLLTEILLRLPIKSLIKFKSVSKHWLALISDPKFSRRRSLSPPSASGLFIKRSRVRSQSSFRRDFYSVSFTCAASVPPFRPSTFAARRASNVDIMQSCNGLLLCSHRGSHYVYNPTTKHYTTLPGLPFSDWGQIYCLALAFDPCRSPHYKVICVTNSDPEHQRLHFLVYSSDSGPWRSTQASFVNDINIKLNRGGAFCNGSIHWLSSYMRTTPYFHVATEEIRQMPMPPVPAHLEEANYSFSYFGASGDRLHLVDLIHGPRDSTFDVFELERDYSKWVVKYRVDISEVLRAFPEMIPFNGSEQPCMSDYYLSVICVVRCRVEEDSFVVMNIPGKLVGYNFRTGRFSKLCDVEPYQHLIGEEIREMLSEPFDVYQYLESLACV